VQGTLLACIPIVNDTFCQTEQVRSLLLQVIDAQNFPGKAELLAQVPSVEVVGGALTFLDLAVDDAAVARSTFQRGPVPGQTWVLDEAGAPIGTLLVWVDKGYISALEYGWVTDQPPTALPSTDSLRSTR
jgi:hypothetical protein